MARIQNYFIGIFAFSCVAATSTASNIHSRRTHFYDGRTQTYTVVDSAGTTYSVTVNTVVPQPAMAAEFLVLKHPFLGYPRPENDAKWDNRLKSFAQYAVSYNVAAHYRS
jgi:hypothetical protein